MNKICAREGCKRRPNRDRDTCSLVCSIFYGHMTQAQRICEATGDAEHWAAAVAVNDALTDYFRSDSRVYRAARDVGITNEQWQAIKRGHPQGVSPRPGSEIGT